MSTDPTDYAYPAHSLPPAVLAHYRAHPLATLHLRRGIGVSAQDGDRCAIQECRAAEGLDATTDRVFGSTISRVIAQYVIRAQDAREDWRTEIARYLPQLHRTAASTAVELRRAYRYADHACRVSAPLALDAACLHADAATLRALAPIVDCATAWAAWAAWAAAWPWAEEAAEEAAWAAWAQEAKAAEAEEAAEEAEEAAAWAAWAAAEAEAAEAEEAAEEAAWAAAEAEAAQAAQAAAWAGAVVEAALALAAEGAAAAEGAGAISPIPLLLDLIGIVDVDTPLPALPGWIDPSATG